MKKASKIFIALILVLALALAVCACNPKDDTPVNTRPDTVDNLVLTALQVQDIRWKTDLTEEEILALPLPGQYVVANEWAKFMGEVILDSALQEGKIKAITEWLSSEEGRALFSENGDVNNLFEALKSIGLTSTDVEGIVYDTVHAFISDGTVVLDKVLPTLEGLQSNTTLSAEARQDIDTELDSMSSAKSAFEYASKDAENAINQLEQAETSIKTLVSFVYNTAMLFGDGTNSSLFEALQKGSLKGASVSEVATYLSSVIASVKEMSATIESDADSLQNAVTAVLDFYNFVAVDVSALDTIMMIVDNNKIIPTVLPLACDFVENVESIVYGDDDFEFLEGILTCFDDEHVVSDSDNANYYIVIARTALAMVGIDYRIDDLESQKANARAILENAMASITSGANNSGGKMAIIYTAFVLNGESTEETLHGIELERMASLVLADIYLDQFKSNYREYMSGIVDKKDAVISSATVLTRYFTGNQNATVDTNFTEEWYNNIIRNASAKIEEEINACYPAAQEEMGVLVDTLSTTVVDHLLIAARLAPEKEGSAEYEALKSQIDNIYTQIAEALLG